MSAAERRRAMSTAFDPEKHWEQVEAELRAQRAAQKQAWGDLDDAVLGRYLAGEVDGTERRHIEAALDERPELRRLTELVRDVLADFEPAAAPGPVTLPFPAPAPAARPAVVPFPQPAARRRTLRRYAGLVAAASVLLGLGLGLGLFRLGGRPADEEVRTADARGERNRPFAQGALAPDDFT